MQSLGFDEEKPDKFGMGEPEKRESSGVWKRTWISELGVTQEF